MSNSTIEAIKSLEKKIDLQYGALLKEVNEKLDTMSKYSIQECAECKALLIELGSKVQSTTVSKRNVGLKSTPSQTLSPSDSTNGILEKEGKFDHNRFKQECVKSPDYRKKVSEIEQVNNLLKSSNALDTFLKSTDEKVIKKICTELWTPCIANKIYNKGNINLKERVANLLKPSLGQDIELEEDK